MCASHDTSRAPPCSACTRTRSGAGAAKTRHDERLVLVFLIAICVIVRACGGWLGTAGRKDGGCVSRTLACPEASRMVIRGGDEEMSKRVERQGPDIRVMRLRERCARGDLRDGR